MGILSSWFSPQPQIEQRSYSGIMGEMLGGAVAGPMVTPGNALASATVYACVQVLAGSVAQMPLKLYRRLERGKEVATDHPLYFLLHDRPNPDMSDYVFKETLMAHLLTWGNAYAEIEWGPDGYPAALWPLLPDRMEVSRRGGQLVYTYKPDMVKPVELPYWRVLHIPGMGFDGLVGYSPVRLQMATLSGDRAVNEYGWRFFANGARPGVVLKHPAKLTPEAAARLRQSWNDLYQGAQNSNRTAVLEDGMGIETLGIPPEEAQFLQTKQFTQRQIAAFYRVPPQMIGDQSTATYASAEQFSADFVKFTLGDWLRRWEAQIALRLLVGEEARQLVPEFVRDALIITQTGERFSAYSTAIQSGILTPNEAREKENMNPLPGGDDLLLPLNMAKAEDGTDASGDSSNDNDADEQQDSEDQPGDQSARSLSTVDSEALAPLVEDARRRLTARIANDVRQQGGKALRQAGRAGLSEWGETQIHEWRLAGEGMLAPTVAAADALGLPQLGADVGAWVATAYQDAVKGLINGD